MWQEEHIVNGNEFIRCRDDAVESVSHHDIDVKSLIDSDADVIDCF